MAFFIAFPPYRLHEHMSCHTGDPSLTCRAINCPDRPTQFWHMPLGLDVLRAVDHWHVCITVLAFTYPPVICRLQGRRAISWQSTHRIRAGCRSINVHPIPGDISSFSADSKSITIILSLSISPSFVEFVACETDIRKRKAR